MRAVRQEGTEPEVAVRVALASLGFEFETNVQDKPGRPDLWVSTEGVAIFVHGCFWHRHEGCSKATTPKRNRDYWVTKFQQNVERDARKVSELEALGYSTVTVWQCETSPESVLSRLLVERMTLAVRQSSA